MRVFTIALLLLLSSCSYLGLDDDEPTTDNSDSEDAQIDDVRGADEIYATAQKALEEKEYKSAAKDFLEVERLHPYSKWATKAQVQAAYAYYKNERYGEAISTLERFTKLNPGNENVAYAYYLIALSYYNQISNVERDQEMTLQARQSLTDVRNRFPDSEYARDAKWKLDLVEDHLAGKEMTVGRYYLEKRQYIGAINRFKKVVEDYPTTAQVEEALHRLVEAYLALGVIPEAQKLAAVLGHNYPGSKWYKDSYDLLIEGEVTNDYSGDDDSWYDLF